MKKALFSLSGLLYGVVLLAQPTITFEKHALIPGEINQMVLVEFLEPGNAGDNQVWDFSELKVKTDFEGAINQTSKSIFRMILSILIPFWKNSKSIFL